MRITVYRLDNSGPPVQLTGERAEEWVEGLEGRRNWLLQPVPRPRASSLDLADRGNNSDALSFLVSRSHDTPNDAAAYYLDHPADVPHLGRVVLGIHEPDGTLRTSRTIERAAIQVTRVRWRVCETVMRYDITGGVISG